MATQIKYSQAAGISRKAIAATMATNRERLIALLKKYGIAVDSNYKDRAIILALLMAMKDPKIGQAFTNELKTIVSGAKVNFTAEDAGFFRGAFDGSPTEFSEYTQTTPTTTTTDTKQKSTLNQVLSNPQLWNTLIGSGTTILSDSLKGKSDKELAQIAKEIEQEKTKQAELLATSKTNSGGGSTNTGMSTGAKIAIGAGIVIVLGVVAYLAFRPKK